MFKNIIAKLKKLHKSTDSKRDQNIRNMQQIAFMGEAAQDRLARIEAKKELDKRVKELEQNKKYDGK